MIDTLCSNTHLFLPILLYKENYLIENNNFMHRQRLFVVLLTNKFASHNIYPFLHGGLS